MKYILAGAVALALAAPQAASAFELTSADISEGATLAKAQVSNVFGCSGGNVSPSLSWKNPPEGTRSYAVTLYDPDAPTGSGWWHWIVYDIPATATSLPSGAANGKTLPGGAIQGRNDAGMPAFMGACPPPGPAHRYVLTVTALKIPKLDLPTDASGAMIGFMVRANALASATLTATYGQ